MHLQPLFAGCRSARRCGGRTHLPHRPVPPERLEHDRRRRRPRGPAVSPDTPVDGAGRRSQRHAPSSTTGGRRDGSDARVDGLTSMCTSGFRRRRGVGFRSELPSRRESGARRRREPTWTSAVPESRSMRRNGSVPSSRGSSTSARRKRSRSIAEQWSAGTRCLGIGSSIADLQRRWCRPCIDDRPRGRDRELRVEYSAPSLNEPHGVTFGRPHRDRCEPSGKRHGTSAAIGR